MSYIGVLQQTDIFEGLTRKQLEEVASTCREQAYGMGEVILEENSASDELYIIAKGEVDILIDPELVSDRPDRSRRLATIATLRRGQSFGEIALVDQGIRSASARSSTHDTSVLVIPREALMALCETDPVLGYRLMRNLAADLATKIRNTDLRIRDELLYSQRLASPPREG